MRTAAIVLVTLVGCKGSSTPAEKAKDGPAAKECPPADQDPDYVHVDRDQLSAMCVSTRLPPVTYPSDHAALVTADGKRTPWLLVWSDADAPVIAVGRSEPVPHASDWLTAAKKRLEWDRKGHELRPDDGKHTGKQWLNILCMGDEAHTVVVTGALFEKKGPHAFAIRGEQILDEALPPDARPDEVFAKAIELTNKVAGGPVQLAKHHLAADLVYLDIAEPWRTALGLKP